jgi:hypothetical protein
VYAKAVSGTCSSGVSSQLYKVDTIAPEINDDGPKTDPNGAGWYNSAVTNGFSASDTTSGLVGPASFTKSSGTDEGLAVKINSGSVTDNAGNTNPGIDSAAFKIDLTKPSVSVTGVSDGATYTLGSVPAAGCSTTDSLSGVKTEASLSVTGGPVGSVTAKCDGAVDNADNTNSASVTYNVEYAWNGFRQPVDNGGVFNAVKAGQSIPMKFSLSGNQGLGVIAASFPKVTAVTCPSATAVVDQIEETTTANNGLTYDSSIDQYNYVWKTQSTYAGKCYRLDMKLIDGTTHTALFKFTK